MAKRDWQLHQYKSTSAGRQVWRWRLIAPNGKKVATSGEAYANRKHCERMCALLFPWIGEGQPPERQGDCGA